jgi:hypothetical protein
LTFIGLGIGNPDIYLTLVQGGDIFPRLAPSSFTLGLIEKALTSVLNRISRTVDSPVAHARSLAPEAEARREPY